MLCFFFSSRRRHTRLQGDWSSDVCSSDLFSSPARYDTRTSGGSTPTTVYAWASSTSVRPSTERSPPKRDWKKDRKSTRLNSSHLVISYAVFCLKKKNETQRPKFLAPQLAV